MIDIRVACSPGELRIAALDGDDLLDYAIHRPSRPDGIGDVYRARVIAHVPGMAGAFLALPGGDGFLPDSEGGAGAIDGALLTVRVTRAAQGSKGPRVSAKLEQTQGSPGLVARGPTPLDDLAARYPDAPIQADDPALVAELRPVFAGRIAAIPRAFDHQLEGAVAALGDSEIALPNGMRATIHPTPALVAIDLDMAAATAGRQSKAAAQLTANQAALPALARQIRLRNLSGAILIDPAGLSLKRRPQLAPALAAALAVDPLRPRLLGFTALGLAEILRPRLRPPLHERLAGPHASGLAALRALAGSAAANPEAIFALVAAPDVHAALEQDRPALVALAHRTGRALIVRSDPALPPGTWQIERST